MKNIMEEDSNNSLHTRVFKEIENAILIGTLAPGDALTEAKLSHELGVSRTPVREALRQLELEGLVKNVPNKGSVVVGFSQKDMEDLYTIRMCIEGLASRWAAGNITEEQKKTLAELVELQEFYCAKNDYEQIWHLDSVFHETLYSACGSRPLKTILSQFHNYLQKPRELSIKSSGRAAAAVKEHREILQAILAGDQDRAENLAKEHVNNAKQNMNKQHN